MPQSDPRSAPSPHGFDATDPAGAPHPRRGGRRRARKDQGLGALAAGLRADPQWRASFEHWHHEPAREARTAPFPVRVDPRIVALFAARGVHELYAHQARFVERALDGADVLVATPTASGKTACYTIPVLQSLLESSGHARALFLFPTKALSQDQAFALTSCIEALGEDWHACTYDGDTAPAVRQTLRTRGHLVLTNPWMLHAGILPNHAKWAELFRELRYIVIDEVHTLSGVFGSHVANVLRRVARIARHYGSDPRFLCCSATLAEPHEHARRLLGRDVDVVDENGAPSGERIFGVLNPPLLNPVAGLRANALEEARRLALALCGPQHQTIFFCRQRTAVEVLTRYLKEQAGAMGLAPEEIHGYRGGYLPLLRREIEDGLRCGRVRVVVSTNALELGIDIGALDVAVLVGYPGSQASFWQRAGRAGRRGQPSLVVQIAQSDPLDQYLVRHPEALFGRAREKLGLDADNLVILSDHVKCAAFELPFRASATDAGGLDDVGYAGVADAPAVLDYLTDESKLLVRRDERWYWMADAYPAQDVSLSGTTPDNVLVLDVETKKAIAEVDRESSITAVHDGAIYQVEGETWIVERFDYANRRAYVRRVDSDYFTEGEVDTELRVTRIESARVRPRARPRATHAAMHTVAPGAVQLPSSSSSSSSSSSAASTAADASHSDGLGAVADATVPMEDFAVFHGEVHVTTVATQYKKIRFYTRENVGAADIHLPPEELDTETFVLTLSHETAILLGLVGGDAGRAWHGLGALLRRTAPLFLRCQPQDLGLAAQIRSPHFGRPALFLYDRVQGGVGLSEALFSGHRAWFAAAAEVLAYCACERGCPACIGPRDEVGERGKECAQRVLEHLVRGEPARAVEVA